MNPVNLYHSSDDNNDDDGDSGHNSSPPSNHGNRSPRSDNTPSFDTNASPVSTLPQYASNPQTPVLHTRNFTTTDIVALILQGDNQRTTNQASSSHANPLNPINPKNPQHLWFRRWMKTLRRTLKRIPLNLKILLTPQEARWINAAFLLMKLLDNT
ncbi:hypothetical protein LIER_41209 [Lithospermum erythrorhizon]|uniref:Uncharacterized protein n=1 Tax=Lithospermum erythrorhizon TaxID=34254 RepID=A0AAV3RA01_LITER